MRLELITAALILCRLAEVLPLAAARTAGARLVSSIKREWKSFLVVGIATWAVALAFNIVLIAFRYGPHVGRHTPVAARGNAPGAAVFWTAISILLTSVVGYRIRVGGKRFWAELRALPTLMRTAVSVEPHRVATQLLWGFAGTMLVVLTMAPALVAVLAVGVAFFLAGHARAVIVAGAMTVWRAVGRRTSHLRANPPAPIAVMVGTFGTIGAFIAGALVGGTPARLGLGLIAAVIAVLLARRVTAATVGVVAVVLPTVLLLFAPAGTVSAAVAKNAPATVSGAVRFPTNVPVVGAIVTANGPDTQHVTTDAKGKYSLKVKPGTYRLVPKDPKGKLSFDNDYLDIELAPGLYPGYTDFTVKPGAAGGAEPASTTTTVNDGSSTTLPENETSTTDAPTTTTAPPKKKKLTAPRTASRGGTVVADFVVTAPTTDLKPKPTPKPTPVVYPKLKPYVPPKPGTPPTTIAPPPYVLGKEPVAGVCYIVQSKSGCYYQVGLLPFHLSEHILRLGDHVSGSVTFGAPLDQAKLDACAAAQAAGRIEYCGSASWNWVPGPAGLTAIGGSHTKPTKQEIVVDGRKTPVVMCGGDGTTASGTCEWVATGVTGGWNSNIGATLHYTGSQDYTSGDFYAVVPDDLAIIEGHVRDRDGNGIPNVAVHIDGPKHYDLLTSSLGYYSQVVEPGDYTVTIDVDGADGASPFSILPGKHTTKLTVAKGGKAKADVTACGSGLLAKLKCGLSRKVLGLAGLLLLPMIPGSTLGLGVATGLSELGSPANVLENLPELPNLPDLGPKGPLHRPAYSDYEGPPEAVQNKMRQDMIHWLRQEHPDQSWPEIQASLNVDGEVNRLFGSWLMTKYARQPATIANQISQDVGGFIDSTKADFESGNMTDRVGMLPGAGLKFVGDLLLGSQNEKTGQREGGLWGFMAKEAETHGVFFVFTMPVKAVNAVIGGIGAEAGLYSHHLDATDGMNDAQRDSYLRANAKDVPFVGSIYQWLNAAEKGDNRALADLSVKFAANVGMVLLPEVGPRAPAPPVEPLIYLEDAVPARPPRPVPVSDSTVVDYSFRDTAIADAMAGQRVRLTPDDAVHFGVEPDVVLESRYNSLQYGDANVHTIDPVTGAHSVELAVRPNVELKLGNPDAMALRATGEYNYKPNFVADKSMLAGEEAFIPADVLANRAPLPGEVVNFKPTHIPPPDDPLYARMLEREKQASAWDSGPRTFDPNNAKQAGYGPMYDTRGKPVLQAEAQRGADARIYTRYQDNAGNWSEWKPAAGDTDVLNVGGGAKSLSPQQALDLPYQAGRGTIPGQGPFNQWIDAMKPADWQDPKGLLKRYEVGRQGTDMPVIKVEADGVFLQKADLGDRVDRLGAAIKTFPPDTWTAEESKKLVSYGLLPAP